MSLLATALKARVPITKATTDDLVHMRKALQLIAQVGAIAPYPKISKFQLLENVLYLGDAADVTIENYQQLQVSNARMLLVNPPKTFANDSLVFDAGEIVHPPSMVKEFLQNQVPQSSVQPLADLLTGLSLKKAMEIVALTQARTGGTKVSDVKAMKMEIVGGAVGLEMISSDYRYYLPPPELPEYLADNFKFFFDTSVIPEFRPKGFILNGRPGTGKTMAAKMVAKAWGLTLYRVDVAAMLDKFIGVSEGRLGKALALAEQLAPCVLLFDEVEKLFASSMEGTTNRMLGQLLWWLENRQAPIISVMTTNDISAIPAEVWRPGRLDMKIEVKMLKMQAAVSMALDVYISLFDSIVPPERVQLIASSLEALHTNVVAPSFAPATVVNLVYSLAKKHGWTENS